MRTRVQSTQQTPYNILNEATSLKFSEFKISAGSGECIGRLELTMEIEGLALEPQLVHVNGYNSNSVETKFPSHYHRV